nr:MAG TPA: hypothetical protein [Inoviridae sp.]
MINNINYKLMLVFISLAYFFTETTRLSHDEYINYD